VGDLPVVRGNAKQLSQVLQNLISNALKYHQAGQPPFVRIGAVDQGSSWLVSVEDRGLGFDPRYANRIFGLFKRLHGSDFPGTGLGLAISKRIIEQHHGRIWAESQPGQGTRFFIELPK
jgi:signal transduction histidine kinase